MKFEKLNESKIKIIFTSKDVILNSISTNDVFTDVSISQQLLQYILFRAEKEIGFKTDDCKLLVEASKRSEGGFVFIITKLSEFGTMDCSNFIYKFENFENFLTLCTYIKNMNFSNFENTPVNITLSLYNNAYYLSISNYFQMPLTLLNAFNEFGEFLIYSPQLDGLISEYGKIIFENNAISKGIKII